MPERKNYFISQTGKAQKRIYVPRACEFCNIKHIQCDRGRPCQNCLKRDRATLCKDVATTRKRQSRTTKLSPNMATTGFNDNNNTIVTRPFEFLSTGNFHTHNYNINNNSGADNFCNTTSFSLNQPHNNSNYDVSNIIENPNIFISNNMTLIKNSTMPMMNTSNIVTKNNSDMTTRNNSYIWSNRPNINQRRRSSDENTMSDITTYTTPKEGDYLNVMKNTNINNNDSDEIYSTVIDDNSKRNQNHRQCLDDISVMNILENWDMNGPRRNECNQLPVKQNQLRLQSASPMFTGVNRVMTSTKPAQFQFGQNNNPIEITDQLFNQLKHPEGVFLNNQKSLDIPHVATPPPTDFEDVENDHITPIELRKHIKTVEDLFTKSYLIKSHNYKKAFQALQDIFSQKRSLMIRDSLSNNTSNDFDNYRNTSESKLLLIKSIQFFITQFTCFAPTMNNKQLIEHEMLFTKTLLEQEQELHSVDNLIVAIWRRSGEISFVNEKFLDFFECTYKEVLGQTRFIFEFWDDETTNRYMSRYSDTMDFTRDDSIQGTLTGNPESTKSSAELEYYDLIKKDGTIVRSLASVTIEKDTSMIPILIIGQLLPVKNQSTPK